MRKWTSWQAAWDWRDATKFTRVSNKNRTPEEKVESILRYLRQIGEFVMPRPTTKNDLLAAATENFEKLNLLHFEHDSRRVGEAFDLQG